ncbi:MAG: (Fe-S)-binding protein, partial [Campylobacterota bacterium]
MEKQYDFAPVTDDCIKCGKCIPGCTINLISNDEVTSPRGFLDLLGAYNRDELELDNTAKDIFESCFLCTHCTDVCPNSLPTDTVIEEVRADIAKKYGIAWYKRAFFFLLRHRFVMDVVSKLGWVVKTCFVKKQQNGLAARFSLPLVKKGRLFPSMASKSFLNSYPQTIKPKNKGAGKVAIFIGCLANYNYTKTGHDLVKILQALDKEIFIPKKQKCCGAPAYFTGDFDTVEYLIRKNIEYFETFIDEVEAIIIPEATCSAM